MSSHTFEAGTRARVHGLQSRPDLNGAEVVLMRLNLDVGRWEVRNVATHECVRVRPGNLSSATAGSHADGPPTALLDHLGPDELGFIFQDLNLKARCTMMQVCTSFRAAASARADAWRECDFGSEPRAHLRDEDVARVLRCAGRQLAVLNVSGRKLTCAALQPLRDCNGLERLSLTGCACVDARALGRDVLPPGEGYLASLSVDGIGSLDEESVGRLKSLVRGSQLDVTECDVCEEFLVCKACAGDCGVQICSEDAEDMLTCDACKQFWCHDCDETTHVSFCDGPCSRTICEDCMYKDGAFLMVCDGCDKRKCNQCAFGAGAYMLTCVGCHTSKCEDCAHTGGAFMLVCDGCHKTKCDSCAFAAGAYMLTCDGCHTSNCEECAHAGEGFMTSCTGCHTTTCDKCMCVPGRFMHICDVCFNCQCQKCACKGPGCSCVPPDWAL